MAKAKSSTPASAQPAGVGFGDKLSAFFMQGRLWRFLAGLVCVGVGLISLLTMLGLNAGSLLIGWTTLLQRAFGIGAWLVCVIAIGIGVALVAKPEVRFTRRLWTLVIFGELAFFSFLALIHTLTFGVDAYQLTLSGGAAARRAGCWPKGCGRCWACSQMKA